MARSDKEPTAPDEFAVLQDRVIRELDKLNERIEAVIGEFVRPRIDDVSADEQTQLSDDDDSQDLRKAA